MPSAMGTREPSRTGRGQDCIVRQSCTAKASSLTRRPLLVKILTTRRLAGALRRNLRDVFSSRLGLGTTAASRIWSVPAVGVRVGLRLGVRETTGLSVGVGEAVPEAEGLALSVEE